MRSTTRKPQKLKYRMPFLWWSAFRNWKNLLERWFVITTGTPLKSCLRGKNPALSKKLAIKPDKSFPTLIASILSLVHHTLPHSKTEQEAFKTPPKTSAKQIPDKCWWPFKFKLWLPAACAYVTQIYMWHSCALSHYLIIKNKSTEVSVTSLSLQMGYQVPRQI